MPKRSTKKKKPVKRAPRKLIAVKACDPKTEQVVSYYEQAAAFFLLHFNHKPSRTTLYKYLTNGYPVEYGGPYVTVPHFKKLKRPYTTRQALNRMLTVIRRQERQLAARKKGCEQRARTARSAA